jgi:hypothetical protein
MLFTATSSAKRLWMLRTCHPFLGFAVILAIGGCAQVTEYPLVKPGVNGQIVCLSGYYPVGEELGPDQIRIKNQCFSACARYGYHQIVYDRAPPATEPKAPDEDVIPFIPKECLP